MLFRTFWPGLAAGLVLAGCTACQNPSPPANPSYDPIKGWPDPPQKISLDRNWELAHGAGGGKYAVIGGVGAYTAGKWFIGFNLATGANLWATQLEDSPWNPLFSDGEFFYVREASALKHYNELLRFNPDGTAAGALYLTLPSFKGTPKDPINNGLSPSGSTSVSWLTVSGRTLFFRSNSPDEESFYPALPGGGGLFAADLSAAEPTAEAGVYALPVRLLHERTNLLTNYDPEMVVFQENGQTFVVFAEVFATGWGGDSTPFRLDAAGNYSIYGPNYDVEYAKKHIGIHCVNVATGQEVWKFFAPWGAAQNRLLDTPQGIYVGNGYESFLLYRSSGAPLWSNPFHGKRYITGAEVGNPSEGQLFLTDSVLYLNKRYSGLPNNLEAVNLNTGQRIWGRQQYATQGFDLAVHDGILYVVNSLAVRLYNAATGEYLAVDDSIHAESFYVLTTNKGFTYGGNNLVIYGESQTWSIKMNWALDLFGKLYKKG